MRKNPALLVAALLLPMLPEVQAEIAVSAEQQAALGIEVREVKAVREAPLATLPAAATFPGDSTQAVVVPLAGTVVRTLVQDGERVSRGRPLIQLRSRDFLEVEALLGSAEARMRSLGAQVERDRQLVREGITSARRVEESEAALRAAQAEGSSWAALLRNVRRVPDAPGDYRLLAPADGVAAEAGLSTGDRVEAEAVAYYISGADNVWVEGQLPERLIDQVMPGYRVEAGDPPAAGKVLSVGRTLDPHTRSALLRAELAGGTGLRPGQATELVVFAPVPAGTVVVPVSALTRIGGEECVFRQSGAGFERVAVSSGLRTAQGVAVRGEGLDGSRVVVTGVSALKVLAQED